MHSLTEYVCTLALLQVGMAQLGPAMAFETLGKILLVGLCGLTHYSWSVSSDRADVHQGWAAAVGCQADHQVAAH